MSWNPAPFNNSQQQMEAEETTNSLLQQPSVSLFNNNFYPQPDVSWQQQQQQNDGNSFTGNNRNVPQDRYTLLLKPAQNLINSAVAVTLHAICGEQISSNQAVSPDNRKFIQDQAHKFQCSDSVPLLLSKEHECIYTVELHDKNHYQYVTITNIQLVHMSESLEYVDDVVLMPPSTFTSHPSFDIELDISTPDLRPRNLVLPYYLVVSFQGDRRVTFGPFVLNSIVPLASLDINIDDDLNYIEGIINNMNSFSGFAPNQPRANAMLTRYTLSFKSSNVRTNNQSDHARVVLPALCGESIESEEPISHSNKLAICNETNKYLANDATKQAFKQGAAELITKANNYRYNVRLLDANYNHRSVAITKITLVHNSQIKKIATKQELQQVKSQEQDPVARLAITQSRPNFGCHFAFPYYFVVSFQGNRRVTFGPCQLLTRKDKK